MFLIFELGYLGQSDRTGKITWGVINRSPTKLIDPKFLVKPKLGNPLRMHVNDIEVYWNDWVTREEEGDPFSFHVFKGKGKEKQQQQEEEQEQEQEDGEMQQEGREDGEDEEDWLKFEVEEGGAACPSYSRLQH